MSSTTQKILTPVSLVLFGISVVLLISVENKMIGGAAFLLSLILGVVAMVIGKKDEDTFRKENFDFDEAIIKRNSDGTLRPNDDDLQCNNPPVLLGATLGEAIDDDVQNYTPDERDVYDTYNQKILNFLMKNASARDALKTLSTNFQKRLRRPEGAALRERIDTYVASLSQMYPQVATQTEQFFGDLGVSATLPENKLLTCTKFCGYDTTWGYTLFSTVALLIAKALKADPTAWLAPGTEGGAASHTISAVACAGALTGIFQYIGLTEEWILAYISQETYLGFKTAICAALRQWALGNMPEDETTIRNYITCSICKKLSTNYPGKWKVIPDSPGLPQWFKDHQKNNPIDKYREDSVYPCPAAKCGPTQWSPTGYNDETLENRGGLCQACDNNVGPCTPSTVAPCRPRPDPEDSVYYGRNSTCENAIPTCPQVDSRCPTDDGQVPDPDGQ